ncbi:MAG: ABC transporter permease subunit [Victivallaceae bacterium]|nr:ABC transporter permease subunit [Victivallaceae bacterium]
MFNFFRIADNTFKESIREPIFCIMLLATLVILGHLPSVTLFVFSEQLKLVVDGALAATLTFGMLAVILSSTYTVSREMRNGTVLLLLSKPVNRMCFVLAKITGILLAGGIFVFLGMVGGFLATYIATDEFRFDMVIYFAYLGTLLVGCLFGMAMNFWKGYSFPAATTLGVLVLLPILLAVCFFSSSHPELSLRNLLFAFLLVGMAVGVMTLFAVILSLRFDMVTTLCCCAVILFLGLISSYLFQRQTDSGFVNGLFACCYALIPNWQYYWTADAITTGRMIPFGYVLTALVYSLLYAFIGTLWAVTLFQNKELAADNRQ